MALSTNDLRGLSQRYAAFLISKGVKPDLAAKAAAEATKATFRLISAEQPDIMVLPTQGNPDEGGGPLELVVGFDEPSSQALETEGVVALWVSADMATDRPLVFGVEIVGTPTLVQGRDWEFFTVPQVFIGEGQMSGSLRIRLFNNGEIREAINSVVFRLTTDDPNVSFEQQTHELAVEDVLPSPVIEFGLSSLELSQGGAAGSLQITASNPNALPTTVFVRSIAGNLVRGTDISYPEEVTIPGGGPSVDFAVAPLLGGGFGTSTLELYDPSRGAVGEQATLDIEVVQASPTLPTLQWKPASRAGVLQEAGASLTLEAELVGVVSGTIDVDVVRGTIASTAGPEDYEIVGGVTSFTLSDAVRTISIEVRALADAVSDDGENLTLRLDADLNEVNIPNEGRFSRLTIGDTPPGIDPLIPPVRVGSPLVQSVVPGVPAEFRVVRDATYPGETVIVVLAPSPNSTAVEGVDYDVSALQLVFGPSDTSKAVQITALQADVPRRLELEIIEHRRTTGAAANGYIEQPSSASYEFGQVIASFAATEYTFNEGATGGNVRVQIPAALSGDLELTLVQGAGNCELNFSNPVTIPTGQTFVDVPVTITAAGATGQRGCYLEILNSQATVNRCLVIANDVRVLETPTFEILTGHCFAAPGVAQFGAVKCTNFGLADFGGGSVTVTLTPTGCSLDQSTLIFDGSAEVIAFTATPSGPTGAFRVEASGTGVDTSKVFIGHDGLMNGKSAELYRKRIPMASSNQLVRFTMPALAPKPEAQGFTVGGVQCEVHDKLWDHETGHVSEWLCCAYLNVGASDSIPRENPLVVTGGSGLPAGASLQALDLRSLELRCTTAQGTVFSSRPFEVGHSTIRKTEVRRDGDMFREEVVTVELTNGVDACTAFRIARQTRCDMECEVLIIQQVHGKRDKTEPAGTRATTGYGKLYFERIELLGVRADHAGVVMNDRPARGAANGLGATAVQFAYNEPNRKFTLYGAITEQGPSAMQEMPTGAMPVRRVAVYRPATVTAAAAQFVVEGRDMAYVARGSMGWTKGGYLGFQQMPDFWADDMPNLGNSSTKMGSIEQKAQSTLNEVLSALRDGRISEPDSGGPRHAGWLKGTGTRDVRSPGQGDITLHGFPLPCADGMHLTLSKSDLYIERHGGALLDTVSWDAMTLADICHETGGTHLPCAFSHYYWPDEHRHPHCLDPSVHGGATAAQLAAVGKPWNSLEPGQAAPYEPYTEFSGHGLYDQYAGMQVASHMSRYLSWWVGAHYIMDDVAAEFAIRVDGHLKGATATHMPLSPSVAGALQYRLGASGEGSSLYGDIVANGRLTAYVKGKGFHPSSGLVSGFPVYNLPATCRNFVHPIAATLFMLATYPHDADEVAIYDTYAETLEEVFDWCGTGTGLLFVSSWNNQDGARYDPNQPADYDTLTGTVPWPGHDDLPGKWLACEELHEPYINWAFVQLDKRRRRSSGYSFALQRYMNRAQIREDGLEALTGTKVCVPESFGAALPGMKGLDNPPIYEVEARRGAGTWRGAVPPEFPFGTHNRISAWLYASLVSRRFSGLGRFDGAVEFLERGFAYQAGRSTDEVLALVANMVGDGAYRGRADYTLQALPAIGALQLSKTLDS